MPPNNKKKGFNSKKKQKGKKSAAMKGEVTIQHSMDDVRQGRRGVLSVLPGVNEAKTKEVLMKWLQSSEDKVTGKTLAKKLPSVAKLLREERMNEDSASDTLWNWAFEANLDEIILDIVAALAEHTIPSSTGSSNTENINNGVDDDETSIVVALRDNFERSLNNTIQNSEMQLFGAAQLCFGFLSAQVLAYSVQQNVQAFHGQDFDHLL